jgi:hypothetical protein
MTVGFLDRIFGKEAKPGAAAGQPATAAKATSRIGVCACPSCAFILWPPTERARNCPWCFGEIVLLDLVERPPRDGDLIVAMDSKGEMLLRRYRVRGGLPTILDAKGHPTPGAEVRYVVDTAGRPPP